MPEPATPHPNRAPTPSPQTQRLGGWRSQGHIVGDQPVPITGTDTYQWLPGGDVAPVARPAAAEAGGAVQSTLTISPDRSGMTARWERSDDGTSWQPWMDMTFTRMP